MRFKEGKAEEGDFCGPHQDVNNVPGGVSALAVFNQGDLDGACQLFLEDPDNATIGDLSL